MTMNHLFPVRSIVGLVVLSGALSLGCGSGASSTGASGTGGGGGQGEGVDVSAWVGNWSVTGTQATTCGAAEDTTQVTAVDVITAGSAPGTIDTNESDCSLPWDLSEDATTATLESGQVCTVIVGADSVPVDWTQSTLTRNGDTMTGTSTGATNNGCSFSRQITATKTM